MELADTTVWSWSRRKAYPQLREWFDDAVVDGEIAICDMVRLELLHSVRDVDEFRALSEDLDGLPQLPLGEAEWTRALWGYERLADQGRGFHRTVKHQDLLIAAVAEEAGVTLVHYDQDYDAIGRVTGQPTRWLAPKGSLR